MSEHAASSEPAGVVPYLCVSNAAGAIDFYTRAFGAREINRMPAPDGRIMHAHLELNGGAMFLSDDFPEMSEGKNRTPESMGGCPATMHLCVRDVDQVVEQAQRAGATVAMPPTDMFWGDRFAKVKDPYGYAWSITAPLERPMDSKEREAQLAAFGGA